MTMTRKENYLTALRGGKPEWVPSNSTDSQVFMPSAFQDPSLELYAMFYEAMEKGEKPRQVKAKDGFGITWVLDDYGPITEPGNLLLNDVEEWKEKYTIPDLTGYDWDTHLAEDTANFDPEKAVEMVVTGPFLQMVNAMGFENTLVALAAQQDETREFLDAVVSFLEEVISNTLKRVKCDCLNLADDFANARSLFMSPDMFREMLLPYEKRLIDCAKAAHPDIVVMLHTCGKCEDVLPNMVEAGIQVWQPAQELNDLKKIQETFGNRLTFMGAWNNVDICADDNITEEGVRQSVRECLDKYAKNGAYIFWECGPLGFDKKTADKLRWAMEEADSYGHNLYQE